MKKSIIFCTVLSVLLLICPKAFAQYSTTAPSGQTIYWYFLSHSTNICICFPAGMDFNYDSTYYQPWCGGYRYSYTQKPAGDLVIPDSITYMGVKYPVVAISKYAFACCDSLTSVTIPNSVTSIGDYAFWSCTELASIHLGNNLKRIGKYAFEDCTNVDTLIIPNSVSTIGVGAFDHCRGLNYLVIGENVVSIGAVAFDSCINLTTVIFNADSCRIAGYDNTTPYWTGAYQESARAFIGCTNVTNFTIGNNVKIIPPLICYMMYNLTNIAIPESVSYIGDNAFTYSGLRSVVFNADSCTYAGGDNNTTRAFICCDSINSFTFGNNVKVIPDGLCNDMRLLTSVTIPSGVTYIGKAAFAKCVGIVMPITIPGCVTCIGQDAFNSCISLPSVIISQSVDSIGDFAFYNCGSLDSVYMLPVTPPAIGSNSFANSPYTPYFIFDGCIINNYINHPDWQRYYYYFRHPASNIIINIRANDSIRGEVGYYGLSCDSTVTIWAQPNTGYRFDHWSTGSTSLYETVYLTGDTTIIAYFVPEGGTEGIFDVEQDAIHVLLKNGRIIVDGVKNEDVQVFDIMGRQTKNDMLPNGVYLVKVGDYPARKVVVIK